MKIKSIPRILIAVCMVLVLASCSQQAPPDNVADDSAPEIVPEIVVEEELEVAAPEAPPEEESEDDAILLQPAQPVQGVPKSEGDLRVKLFHDDAPWLLIDGETVGAGPVYCFISDAGERTVYYFSHMDHIENLASDFPYNLFTHAGQDKPLVVSPFFDNRTDDYIQITSYYYDQSGEIQTLTSETRTLTLYRDSPQALFTMTHEFEGHPASQEYYNLVDGAYDSLLLYLQEKGQGHEQDEYDPLVG